MMGWGISAAVIVAILCLNVGVLVQYDDENGVSLKLLVGGIPWKLSSDDVQSEDDGPIHSNKKGSASPKRKQKGKAWAKAVLTYRSEIFDLIGRVLSAPTLEVLRFQALVGGSDPGACALSYGRTCGAVSAMLPVIESVFCVRSRHIDVQCDLESNKTVIKAEASAKIHLYELLSLALMALDLLRKMFSFVKSNYESGAKL